MVSLHSNLHRFHRISNLPHAKLLKTAVFMSIVYPAILIGVLVSDVANAGSFTGFIKERCPNESRLHKETVKEFAIRMKLFVEECGCGVVNLYYALGDSNLELISSLEEDMDLMRSAAKVFEISDDLTDAMKQSPDTVETLTLMANSDPDIFHKLSGVLSTFSGYDARQLRKDPSYILYYLLGSAMVEENTTTSDLKLIIKNLKRNVSLNAVSALTMLYLQSMIVYPNADPNYWLSAAERTLKSLGTKTVKSLSPYKEHLALFLPPKEADIPESQNLSDRDVDKIRDDYMSLMAFVFDLIDRAYNSAYALKVTEHISPYLLEALRFHKNKTEIIEYLKYEFSSDSFKHVLQNGVCQSGSGDAGLEDFFIMYSPYDKGRPVPGTEGNLGLIARLFGEGTLKRYVNEERDINGYIYTMSLLPSIYFTLTQKQQSVFNDLLFNLSDYFTLNGRVIIALYNTTGFFSWVQNSPDAFSKVVHNEEAVQLGHSAPKYKYILLTSYPKDDSPSILHSFGEKPISSNALNNLMNMSVDELEAHNFTDGERIAEMAGRIYDIADWTVTVVSIAAVPLTAGASAGVAAMMLARKGAISAAKRTVKSLAKKSLKSATKLIGQQGWKVAKREGKEIMGWAAKRGRKSVKEEAIKKGITTTDKWATRVDIGRFVGTVAAGATAYFLAKTSNDSASEDLCREIAELKKGE